MMMRLSESEFKKLQQHWYGLLADAGFEDIEQDDGVELKQRAFKPFINIRIIQRVALQEYYIAIGHIVNDEKTVFRSNIDRYILTRHAEGAKIMRIMEELIALGTPRHRHSIRYIIRRYEVRWGLKSYKPNQLNSIWKKKHGCRLLQGPIYTRRKTA